MTHPEGIETAPASLREAPWRRVRWSGNPPVAPIVMGWRVRLGRHTSPEEKTWFRQHGYVFSGGQWGRPDGGFQD